MTEQHMAFFFFLLVSLPISPFLKSCPKNTTEFTQIHHKTYDECHMYKWSLYLSLLHLATIFVFHVLSILLLYTTIYRTAPFGVFQTNVCPFIFSNFVCSQTTEFQRPTNVFTLLQKSSKANWFLVDVNSLSSSFVHGWYIVTQRRY